MSTLLSYFLRCKVHLGRLAGTVSVVVGLLAGCALGPVDTRPVFLQEADAGIIIRYSSDETIFLERPTVKEGDFYSILDRRTTLAEISKSTHNRALAVIVIGAIPDPVVRQRIIDAWTRDLRSFGYQRAVFLGEGRAWAATGRPIIADVSLQ